MPLVLGPIDEPGYNEEEERKASDLVPRDCGCHFVFVIIGLEGKESTV
jgi:hypothetical protein